MTAFSLRTLCIVQSKCKHAQANGHIKAEKAAVFHPGQTAEPVIVLKV